MILKTYVDGIVSFMGMFDNEISESSLTNIISNVALKPGSS